MSMKWRQMVAVAFALAISSWPDPAGAAAQDVDHFHDQFDFVLNDFCGDLDIRIVGDFSGIITTREIGRDGLSHYTASSHGTETTTNLVTGLSVTLIENGTTKDIRVVDNGDGTLTVLAAFNGRDVLMGPHGERLGHATGSTRTEILLDHGGTPTDPSDDEVIDEHVISRNGLRQSPGADFCAVLRDVTTPEQPPA